MNVQLDTAGFFESVARILIRSFFMGLSLIPAWFVVYFIFGDLIYWVNSLWFDLSRTDFDKMLCLGLAVVQFGLFVFFLFYH